MSATVHVGDALSVLATLPDRSVRCCVTSPPYWGLRDYGYPEQIGIEPTPAMYVERMVAVLREVRRVLTDDGTLWLNLGDSYSRMQPDNVPQTKNRNVQPPSMRERVVDLAPKNLVGIPWRVAFALQSDGWYLRSDIIWAKPNPMPESVTDRPTKAHEYVFLLSKSERYYYDAAAIAEPALKIVTADEAPSGKYSEGPGRNDGGMHRTGGFVHGEWRNARTVWTISTRPYAGAHFATMPEELAQRCILAGSAAGDLVLDPFGGSGTTAAVAVGNGRRGVIIEANPDYCELARMRIGPMLCSIIEPARTA